MTPQASPDVNPQLFWDTMTAYQRTAALKAAVDLELFTRVAEGKSTAADIADAVGAAERSVRILCDTLSIMGFLNKTGGEYKVAPSTAAFLDKRSPMYLGGTMDFIFSPQQRRGFDDLTNAVRHGGSQVKGDASMDPNSEMWVTFARSMAPMMYPTAEAVAANIGFPPDQNLKVLDIAAGHGIYGIVLAKHYPKAEVYGADWENVLTVAQENAAKHGVAERYHIIPGDAFDSDFGGGYDVILLPNFLHHFDRETCIKFIEKLSDSLAEGGQILTVEFVPNEDRVTPPPQAMFSLVMLAATPGGDAYTFAELRDIFETAGFARNEMIRLEPMPQTLIISQK
jgi:cyclopropane fatty-acyl-phospholipid synthase-like methyltransferase